MHDAPCGVALERLQPPINMRHKCVTCAYVCYFFTFPRSIHTSDPSYVGCKYLATAYSMYRGFHVRVSELEAHAWIHCLLFFAIMRGVADQFVSRRLVSFGL